MREKQIRIWNLILASLEKKVAVMLLYVLESNGSSPGRQGFFMAVNAGGEMQGSIGGGIMEHKFVEMAKDKLLTSEDELSVRKQIHDKAAAKNQSGMICSGEQTILLYRIQPGELDHVRNIVACLEQGKSGTLQLSPQGLAFTPVVPEQACKYAYQSKEDWLLEERIGYKNTLHIIGAGHCALALSRVMQMMDFYICLYDDRPGLPTLLENNYVHQKIFLKDYAEVKELIKPGNDQFVVVMTMGYRTDDIVVRALMNKQLRYFGVLGSNKKLETLFAGYLKEGIPKDSLEKIWAPVGLPVHSKTPEEIAVSIAAQIIAIKNWPAEGKP